MIFGEGLPRPGTAASRPPPRVDKPRPRINARGMPKPRDPRPDKVPREPGDREALIDETLEETFPASDPPTWDTIADPSADDETPLDPNLPD
jgi:hypothetical protein